MTTFIKKKLNLLENILYLSVTGKYKRVWKLLLNNFKDLVRNESYQSYIVAKLQILFKIDRGVTYLPPKWTNRVSFKSKQPMMDLSPDKETHDWLILAPNVEILYYLFIPSYDRKLSAYRKKKYIWFLFIIRENFLWYINFFQYGP